MKFKIKRPTEVAVEEPKRRVIGTAGGEVTLHNVTMFDSASKWLRLYSDEGYTLVNQDNVLAMVIQGARVR